ncbi:MAG: histidinol-phosphate transaminase, partial [Planctomycetota bacterium]
MSGYIPGEQPKDGIYIKLNTNENPYPPSPKVLNAVKEAVNDNLRLYPDPIVTAARIK